MVLPERDDKGRFINGHKGGGGRPPRATEKEYLEAFKDAVPLERFLRMVERQAHRAEKGDLPAFSAICKYLGLDIQKIEQNNSGNVTVTIVYEQRVQHPPTSTT